MEKRICNCLVVLGVAFALASLPALAQTPDGETPAEESVCENEIGALKGLCNAYCEAMDCHLDEGVHASQQACDRVLDNYRRKSDTGGDPPCLQAGCAATATAIADEWFFDCVSGLKPHCRKCAYGAQAVFSKTYTRCVYECRGDCLIIAKNCTALCGDDIPCQVQCKEEYTSCTSACADGMVMYEPPDCN